MQMRYTHQLDENLTISASLENSEFSGRDADGFGTESSTVGIRAGLDKAPDFTLAATWREDWGFAKLAGVGRYIINGVGRNALVDASGDVDTIEAWGGAAQISQKVTEEITVAAAFGRTEIEDSFAPEDLKNTNSVHASLFWRPIDRLLIGREVIWGNREDADGASDSTVRLQSSVQVKF